MKISEKFIEFIWQTRRFDFNNLTTTSGQKLRIISFGNINRQAGPDISYAKIYLDGIEWVGSIEFHCKSSDWIDHGHDENDRFDNVILHVVWEEDRKIKNKFGNPLPCLEISQYTNSDITKRAEQLVNNKAKFIPCENLILDVEPIVVESVFSRLGIEKLEAKKDKIKDLYTCLKGDLNQTIFVYVTRYFGLTGNQGLMEELALRIPYSLIRRYSQDIFKIEAILFGTSQLLEGNSSYVEKLRREFEYLSELHSFQPFLKNTWKFSGRPPSFPTYRLASLAAVLTKTEDFVKNLLSAERFDGIVDLFQSEKSDFWSNRFTFKGTKSTELKTPPLGKQFIELITINAIVPLFYFVGKEFQNELMISKAERILSDLKPEKNGIVTKWNKLGIQAKSAFQSQAILHLYENYCKHKDCLRCSIGYSLMR